MAQAVLELPRTNQAPRIARKWLAESFAAQLDAREQETAKLLVSELVTNAVVHGRGRIELLAALDRERLLVEVSDEGPGLTSGHFHAVAGHGLWIVHAEASRWGIREGTAHIWFELQRCQTASDRSMPGATPDAELAALYRRLAETLQRSAKRAEQHAERERRLEPRQSVRVQLDPCQASARSRRMCPRPLLATDRELFLRPIAGLGAEE